MNHANHASHAHTHDNRRKAFIERASAKCNIQVSLDIDGGMLDFLPNDEEFKSVPDQKSLHHASQITACQTVWIWTGVGFFDHMLHALAKHAGWSLRVRTVADLAIDDHHTVEETTLALGSALTAALGDRTGLARYGFSFAPLDEALCRAVVDLSNRPFFVGEFGFQGEKIGDLSTQMVWHALQSLSQTGGITLHVDVLRGNNDHHRCEAAFKALALAMKMACERIPHLAGEVISTKGVL
ncbi:imidazoleglycerol-phosphate dehydratase [Nemania abortiva]|nr:imidazoleglycerol-phosphate dehydratase [Nemania abortiva]